MTAGLLLLASASFALAFYDQVSHDPPSRPGPGRVLVLVEGSNPTPVDVLVEVSGSVDKSGAVMPGSFLIHVSPVLDHLAPGAGRKALAAPRRLIVGLCGEIKSADPYPGAWG